MIEVWKDNRLVDGNWVSDGRLMFRRTDVVNNRLLKKIDKPKNYFTQKKPSQCFTRLKQKVCQLLELDSLVVYKGRISNGMLFVDCFGGEWAIQRKYYQLTKKLLNFDFLIGGEVKRGKYVMFVKNSEIIGALMCFV